MSVSMPTLFRINTSEEPAITINSMKVDYQVSWITQKSESRMSSGSTSLNFSEVILYLVLVFILFGQVQTICKLAGIVRGRFQKAI